MASVRSAEELVLALDSGERDIVLHSHIHLRTLQLNRRIDNLLVLSSTTKSLRVCLCSMQVSVSHLAACHNVARERFLLNWSSNVV